ncbi:hypothetical protein [Parafilimonas terrae]|jgi:hypothetical protein|uniref:Uncharacterized protein n=1 Tax=Parafilimonas terrae TaxID=1465490 RepID=A0A1I5RB60_9BACT|nr:hypothetical protein [Parafilimonas terrae]SFP55577.1 hypothetical protein SAMN05444277_101162 [Parafilimonas terrae]
MVQTFSSFVFDAAYSLNKNYIAENFCINKSNPETHCEGHCFLNKQKQKEEGSNKQAADNKTERLQVAVYELPQEITATVYRTASSVAYGDITDIELQGYTSSIFHPPLA